MEHKNYVEELKNSCTVFLKELEITGNEDAYTDHLLENVFESFARLKDFHDKTVATVIVDEVKIVRSMDELRDYLEEKGWRVSAYEHDWEIGQGSPAGEDFWFSIIHNNDVKEAITEIKRYAYDFDIEEHVKMWVEAQGRVSGVPDTVTLVEDAKAIQDMLDELADGVNWCEQKTIAEILAEAEGQKGDRLSSAREITTDFER